MSILAIFGVFLYFVSAKKIKHRCNRTGDSDTLFDLDSPNFSKLTGHPRTYSRIQPFSEKFTKLLIGTHLKNFYPIKLQLLEHLHGCPVENFLL